MERLASLIQWIITFSLTGGFWRFVGCAIVIGALARVTNIVRINIDRRTLSEKEDA